MPNINPNIQKEQLPLNVSLLDTDTFIKTYGCQEITSYSIHTASTTQFHPHGLFSEEIFGQIGSNERLVRFGYIDLNANILEPIIYKTVIKLKALYGEIILGSSYAVFDEEEQDFVKSKPDDPKGFTGYTFFTKHMHKIKFRSTVSTKRDYLIALLDKYRNNWYSSKQLVSPAGVRDIDISDKMLASDDVNKLYISLMSYAGSMPKSDKSVYDSIRVNILKKRTEIFDHYMNMLNDKKGFLQFSLGRRTIANGTRNVISATRMDAYTPTDTRSIKYDETQCPLYQTAKAFQPLVIYQLRVLAFDNIFTSGVSKLSVIDPKTFQLKYVEVDPSVVETYRATDGYEAILNRFQDPETRYLPISVVGLDKVSYYLYGIYDTGDKIILFRNIDDLVNLYKEEKIDKTKIRALTWLELVYIATYIAVQNKHVFVTRYPIGQGPDSCYPSKIRLVSTIPNRQVELVDLTNPANRTTFSHYPIIENNCVDSLGIFPGRLVALAADFDGDVCSLNGVYASDANNEISTYLASWSSVISPQQTIYAGGNKDNIIMSVFNLSLDA